MKYLYYPGCSLKGTGKAYEESLLAVFRRAELQVEELPGWNCCGATAYMSVDEVKAFALAARNLSLAEDYDGQKVSLIAPCSACYLVLMKAQKHIRDLPELGTLIKGALAEVGLKYRGTVNVRHPLDVLVNDIGLEKIAGLAKNPLKGMKVACYYGCQVVRPYATFDDQHDPMTMDRLLRACGAETVDWPLKTRCCGGTLTGTVEEAGLRLSYMVLAEARRRGANMVATACPLCQFNLECYQGKMRRRWEWGEDLPVAFFTQLVGMAMGLGAKELGLKRLLVPVEGALATA